MHWQTYCPLTPLGNPGLQPATYTVAGVVGKQKLLYVQQIEGFKRDAEQKLSKIYADIKNTQMAANSATSFTDTGFEDSDMLVVLDIAKASIVAQ